MEKEPVKWGAVIGGLLVALFTGVIVGTIGGILGAAAGSGAGSRVLGAVAGMLAADGLYVLIAIALHRRNPSFASGLLVGGCIVGLLAGACDWVMIGNM